jgi:hypothetical protein
VWAPWWVCEIDTSVEDPSGGEVVAAGATVRVAGRSMVVLRSDA